MSFGKKGDWTAGEVATLLLVIIAVIAIIAIYATMLGKLKAY
jgi:hypothetical protein